MPRAAYSEEDRRRVREGLLTTALKPISTQGIQHTTVEQVYRSVGISRSFFYAFFPTKEGLIVEVLYLQQPRLLEYAHSRMEELAERLNLDLSRRIGDLSLGNKKKVGIVSALLPSPKLLIMDEPTSGLDPLIQQAFYDILKEENKRGVTIFLSSHVLSEVQRLCDRVAILREGKLISVQSMKELRENGYKKISLTAKSAIPEDFFSVPGTANLEWDKSKTSVSFMFSGPVMMIMNQLHRLELEDILIEEPSLEEVFLHYYE